MIPVEMPSDAIPGGDAGQGTERDAVTVVILCQAFRTGKDRWQEREGGRTGRPAGLPGSLRLSH